MESKVVSNFWTALIAAVVLVVTALLLENNEHCGKVLIMQGVLFGVRVADQATKAYQLSKTNPEKLKI